MVQKTSSVQKTQSKGNHDYKKLGFKCGLEIHQQLDTHNLFCSCPSIVHDTGAHVLARRRLKAVVGETGEIDTAAAHEQKKSKEMVYEGCDTSYCLIELDEEPPRPMNQEALHIALTVAKMLHCEIVDEIQVMRKTVIDGSNVSGFQRTALVGMNGYIETSLGRVGVPTLCLEEEAAKKLQNTGNDSETHYRIDRLGVTLLEIATDASIQNPEHAKECAEQLGMILRSTGKVKRGIGSIRQDVNVSIKGGVRVEIKGFQDLRSIPKVITYEINRQYEAVSQKKKLQKEVRKAEPDFTTSFLRPMPGAARLYPETDVLPVPISKELLDSIVVPQLLSEQKELLQKEYGLDQGIIDKLLKRDINMKEWALRLKNLSPTFIASSSTATTTEIERKEKVTISNDVIYDVLLLIDKGSIPKDAFSDVVLKKTRGEKIDLGAYASVDDAELEKAVAQIIVNKPGLNVGGYMGLVMAQFKGKVDGKKASAVVAKLLKK